MNKLFRNSALLVASLGLFSCEKMVDNLYENPNNPSDAPAEFILPSAALGVVMVQEGEMARLSGIWSGYFTGADRQYVGLTQYNATAGDFDSPWGTLYAGAFAQSKLVAEKSDALGNRVLAGIAKVQMASAIGTAAALWGDVPFTEASSDDFANPKYDSQTDVYAGAQSLLDEAIADLESGIGGLKDDSKDIFFGGDTEAWMKVAHSLKARFYMHTKNYSAAYAQAQMGVTSPSDSWMAPHGPNLGEMNLYNYFLDWERTGYMSADGAFLPSILDPESPSYRGNAKTDETARKGYYYIDYEIYAAGYEPNFFNQYWWGEADGMFGALTAFPLMSYEENVLTLAEAGARTVGISAGLEHLNEFRAYMSAGGFINPDYGTPVMEAYESSDFSSGGMENQDGISQSDALLREILEERYVTFYGQLEGYNDLRRTMKESVRVMVPPTNGNTIPLRFVYPQNEVNSNSNIPGSLPDLFTATPVNQ